jgi:hypothetical protein
VDHGTDFAREEFGSRKNQIMPMSLMFKKFLLKILVQKMKIENGVIEKPYHGDCKRTWIIININIIIKVDNKQI